MNPILIDKYVALNAYDELLENVKWTNAGAPRMECFMSETPKQYGYDTKDGLRFYESIPYYSLVLSIQNKLNKDYNTNYNVCFLNYYNNEKQHLGWHSDDSDGMNLEHPIAVVSFGQERFIYVKDKSYKGEVPNDNKFLLGDGSLFIMPSEYQKEHLHKIPKGDKIMTGRISLTFRNYTK